MLADSTREWHLHPETEYRFELDPATSLAIKVPSHHRRQRTAHLDTSARPWSRRDIWRRARRRKVLSLWLRVQGRRLHLARMHHPDKSLFTPSQSPAHPPSTSPAVPPQSMSRTRHQWPLMQTSTSLSNRCVSVPSVTSTDPPLPTTINTPTRNRPGSLL